MAAIAPKGLLDVWLEVTADVMLEAMKSEIDQSLLKLEKIISLQSAHTSQKDTFGH